MSLCLVRTALKRISNYDLHVARQEKNKENVSRVMFFPKEKG